MGLSPNISLCTSPAGGGGRTVPHLELIFILYPQVLRVSKRRLERTLKLPSASVFGGWDTRMDSWLCPSVVGDGQSQGRVVNSLTPVCLQSPGRPFPPPLPLRLPEPKVVETRAGHLGLNLPPLANSPHCPARACLRSPWSVTGWFISFHLAQTPSQA